MVTLKSPQNGEKISLLTDVQIKFLKTDRTNSDAESIDYLNLKKVGENHTFPKPVLFEWEGFGDGTVFISENKSFENYFSISGKNSSMAENLKCNTRYFWKVICDNEESDTFFFDTEDTFPRFIRVDGILNVRDCGGWKTEKNQRIRQGMLYRGSEMNSHLDITPEGLKTMSEDLKIKTVLDLRGASENPENVYGKNYVNIPCFPYSDWFLHPDVALKIFELLSDEKNYPLYFHCWGGADRTGTLAFIIGAVLGQNIEDLLDDYEITSLAIWGSRSRNTKEHCKSFLSDLNSFDGDSLQKKTENHLISCGIKKEQIENLRKIMLY